MGCAKYGGGICVVGLIISDGIVQEVDVISTYGIHYGGKQDNNKENNSNETDPTNQQINQNLPSTTAYPFLHHFTYYSTFCGCLGLICSHLEYVCLCQDFLILFGGKKTKNTQNDKNIWF